tara:strand:+ start:1519 stop:4302 length:2784 start_codon:yes stop_codon:yes gene_type:complete
MTQELNYNQSNSSFDKYLYKLRSSDGNKYTHTRIGDKDKQIYGGTYNIENYDDFYKKYHDYVFKKGNVEYLTERQLIEDGPLLIDVDLKFNPDIKERIITKEHIVDLIMLYMTKISELYSIPDKTKIDVYVSQKDSVNFLNDKTKDGVHIVICIKMHKAIQSYIRKELLSEIESIWDDLGYTNSIEELIDEGVCKGQVNWQLYGSQKPNHKPYRITEYMTIEYSENDDYWSIKNNKISNINILQHLKIISARNSNNQEFSLNEKYKESVKKEIEFLNSKGKNRNNKKITKSCNINLSLIDYNKITSIDQLDEIIEELFKDINDRPIDYELKETHDFTMILPESYYGEGSYNKWIRVGWALKNTSEKLFVSWIKMSSQSSSFTINDIGEYYSMWKRFDNNNPNGLTNRSIMYWAKTDNYKEYQNIRKETVSYFIEQTLEKHTEFDLANVLYQIYKDQFVCVSIKNNVWYEYSNYKWNEIDSGNTLRLLISKKMHDIYMKKVQELVEEILKLDNNDPKSDLYRNRSNRLGEICVLLKTTSWKNNIMKEAKELFYDKTFMNKLDSNPYLLCFNNCVVDFKNNISRKGQPDDYISKSTNIDYIPINKLDDANSNQAKQEVKRFIGELFPEKELEEYMWQHLASTLIGTNENQTFNIYTGSGSNGKSKLVELMSKCLGDYKATVPITLVTQSRNSIGSTSSEIVQLMGVRYAVMQEPSKGDKINEGIMKEITGGDPIQGRALFKDAVTFIPQFKLVVCTNVLFDIKSNDDGTWRRIRVCDFMSKFVDNPYNNEKFLKDNFPHQFQIDKKIDEKFELWAPIFISMLVDIGFKTGGRVTDCRQVLAVSDKYRESQDYLSEFAKEKIQKTEEKRYIKKTEIIEEFKNWYIVNYGRTSLPNGKEITDYMDKIYGKCIKGKWHYVQLVYEDIDDDIY